MRNERLEGLRDRRQGLGLTAAQLSTYLSVSTPNLYMWERGQRRIPEIYLAKLANLFGVAVDQLRREDEAAHELFRAEAIAAVTAVSDRRR